jgi:hypothetical protein
MPPLIPLEDMPTHVRELVLAINKIGDREEILPSMYRHLANWPSFLALAYLILVPIAEKGELEAKIKLGLKLAYISGLDINHSIPTPGNTMSRAAQSQTKEALRKFVNGPIGKMTAIVPVITSSMDVSV